MTDSLLPERLPEEWRGARLRWVSRIYAGGTPSRERPEYWHEGTIPWLNSGAVNDWAINKPSEYITGAGLAGSSARWIPSSSVVMALAGQGKTKGTAARLEIETTCNQSMAALVPGQTLDYRFLHFWLVANYERIRNLGGGDLRDGLNLQMVGDIEIPLPPVEEQRKIADFLDDQVARVDRLITETTAQRMLVEERRSAAIVDTLLARGKLIGRAPWFTDLPATVTPVPLRAMWNVIDCKHRTPDYQEEGIPVISPGDIKPGRLDLSRATRFVNETDYLDLADDLRRCRRGDLVYSRNASAGIPAYVDTDEPFTMGQDVCRITSHHNSQLFLAYALQHLTGPQLDSVRVGSTFTRINVDEIKNLRIPNYDLDTQQRLADECDDIAALHDEWLDELNTRSRQLEERKRALITAAVTGELDVTTAKPIGMGKWVPNVGASVEAPGPVPSSGIGGIG